MQNRIVKGHFPRDVEEEGEVWEGRRHLLQEEQNMQRNEGMKKQGALKKHGMKVPQKGVNEDEF